MISVFKTMEDYFHDYVQHGVINKNYRNFIVQNHLLNRITLAELKKLILDANIRYDNFLNNTNEDDFLGCDEKCQWIQFTQLLMEEELDAFQDALEELTAPKKKLSQRIVS